MAKETKEPEFRMQLRIKDILAEKNILLADLADRLGITRQALSKQVKGIMLVETAEKIAVALDVPLWQLFVSPKEFETKTEQPSTASPAKVGMIMCPHCHCGFEITGVVTPPTE